MQSSAMVAFRATTMIVCMITLPLAAVVGTILPKAVRSAIHGEVGPAAAGWLEHRPQAAAESGEEPAAPPAAATERSLSDDLPRARITGIRAVDQPRGKGDGEERGLPWPTEPPPPRRGEAALRATAYSAPLASRDSPGATAFHDQGIAQTADPLTRAERRLRELGVVSYRLETWGVTGELYRFSCQVALAERGQATRHFEALETSPAKVIEALLEQVEAWHARRR